MLLAIDLYEDFSDVEGIAITTVLSLQSASINRAEFDAPEANCFSADCNAPFGEQVFNIAVTQVESTVEPDCVTNDIWRESVPLISIHEPILPISDG